MGVAGLLRGGLRVGRGSFGRGLREASNVAIIVHGGAWAIPDALVESSRLGAAAAAADGYSVLDNSGSALDAVEAAVRSLERDPAFDAGCGAVLNSAGEVELDAVIMDGRDLRAGAVAALGPILHPVSVARLVMERSEHVLLVGPGATAFAEEHGIRTVPADELVTQAARDEWNAMAAYPNAVNRLFNQSMGHDTVGAVALDRHGNLAAATSTGGITFKRVGRVGDSPVIGAGVLADNLLGAVSTTGHGESILRFTLASKILQQLESKGSGGGGSSGEGSKTLPAGFSPTSAAVQAALEGMRSRLGGCGGAICISPSGELGIGFSTERMAWAMQDAASGGVRCGVDRAGGGGDDRVLRARGVEMVDPSADGILVVAQTAREGEGAQRQPELREPPAASGSEVKTRVRVVTDPASGLKVKVREKVRT